MTRILFLLLCVAPAVFADGGRLLVHGDAGPFRISLFGSPQVGPNDLSVLVQNAANGEPVLDASVQIRSDGRSFDATHDVPANKILYAAIVQLPQAGPVPITITVNSASTNGTIDVAPAPSRLATYWPYFAVVPAAVLLFALNQYLKRQRATRPRARP